MESLLNNAGLEGAADRVEAKTVDMRTMPFQNDAFDIVLSCFAIHNITEATERKKALLEIVRVLKPGGKVCIIDFKNAGEYAEVFGSNGIEDIKRFSTRMIFPPATVVTGRKIGTYYLTT